MSETLRIHQPHDLERLQGIMEQHRLHTVCEEAMCPNLGECYEAGTATFLLLGPVCTRNCGFCAVRSGKGLPPAADEPERVAETVRILNLKHAVVTSVTRDDLPDGGASHFAATIRAIRATNPETTVECLIPDFQGSLPALAEVVAAKPDILGHNLETIPRLYARVCPGSFYQRSLNLFRQARMLGYAGRLKSSLMLGLGETLSEMLEVMDDLIAAGCQLLTIGQYLRPSPTHLPIIEYVSPAIFQQYRFAAYQKGFDSAVIGPLVRSSYQAEKALCSGSQSSELTLQILDIGVQSYRETAQLQRVLHHKRSEGRIADTLLLLEHPAVITIGRGGSAAEILESTAGEVCASERGGGLTYHGPGQLVVYPILDIHRNPIQGDVHRYVRLLEEVILHTLKTYGVQGTRQEGLPGVWTQQGKIAFIGLHLQNGITSHGFSLNLNTDLRPFSQIIPCGLPGLQVTNLATIIHGENVPEMDDIKATVVRHFRQVFAYS